MTTSRYSRVQLFQNRTVMTVRRPGLAGDLAGGANFNIFSVGGVVLVQYMFGHVTTVIGAGAAVPQITHTPTGGAPVNLCAAALSIAADAVNTLYIWDGTVAGVLAPATALGVADAGDTTWAAGSILLTPGIIRITNAAASTGIIDWYITYLPLVPTTLVTPL